MKESELGLASDIRLRQLQKCEGRKSKQARPDGDFEFGKRFEIAIGRDGAFELSPYFFDRVELMARVSG